MACEITDYELQVGITEMMFRLSNRENRASLGRAWFTDELYLDAFLRVKDADFETVCSFQSVVYVQLTVDSEYYVYPALLLV